MTDTDPDFEELALRVYDSGGLAAGLDIDPGSLRIGLDLARARRLSGAYDEALKIYSTLVLCDMREPDYQLGLADCAFEMGEYELCIQACAGLVALDPENSAGYYLSGASCLALGHREEALEDLREARRLAKEARDSKVFQQADRVLSGLADG